MLRFSVLLPTYNQSKYLVQALESLLSQTFRDYEILVIDDGSTDDTPQVLESYRGRVTVIRQSNQGPEVARNKAAQLARGEYLAMLDHDDVLTPDALAVYDRVIRAFNAPPLIIGSMVRFKGENPPPTPACSAGGVEVLKFPDFLSRDIPLQISSSRIVLRKDTFSAAGGYGSPHSTRFNTDDFNLILKVGTEGPCIFVQQPCTLLKRDHDGNISRNQAATAEAMLGLVRSEYAGLYPGGKKRRYDRYANIGGLSSAYALRYCWGTGQHRLAVRLLLKSAPMVLAAVHKKLFRGFGSSTRARVLI